jgi:hypothetical protein
MEVLGHGVGCCDCFMSTVAIDYNISAFVAWYCQLLAQCIEKGDEVLGVGAIANVEESAIADALSNSANNSQTCSSVRLLRLSQSVSWAGPYVT